MLASNQLVELVAPKSFSPGIIVGLIDDTIAACVGATILSDSFP